MSDEPIKLSDWLKRKPGGIYLQTIPGMGKYAGIAADTPEGLSAALDLIEAGMQLATPPGFELPPLSEDEVSILCELRKEHPQAMFLADLESVTNISRRTIGRLLKRLRQLKLTCRRGLRKGEALTEAGLRAVAALSDFAP
jgi:hypothetical protein